VKGQDGLREELDGLVREMIEDGTIKELSDKWFGPGEDVTEAVRELAAG
jgi:ABC-type amino acid transport substrate-binding protein